MCKFEFFGAPSTSSYIGLQRPCHFKILQQILAHIDDLCLSFMYKESSFVRHLLCTEDKQLRLCGRREDVHAQ